MYIECTADEDAEPDDREQWAIANPSYPHRTPFAVDAASAEELAVG